MLATPTGLLPHLAETLMAALSRGDLSAACHQTLDLLVHPSTLAVSGSSLIDAAQRAELIDVDITLGIQAFFFFTLVLVLPRLIFKPMLVRIEQREARTEGARAEAKAMRHAADDRVSTYDSATAEEKRKALEERALVRQSTQKNAADLIAKARVDSAARLDRNLGEQRAKAEQARADLRVEAQAISKAIADKLAPA